MTLKQHSASGSIAGFIYQFERALFWLAKSPAGFRVGIETDDDIAVRGADGSQILEQDKHTTQPNSNPFSNRSKGLWNTLRIWLEALDSREVIAESTRFLMVTNTTIPECIVRQIGLAKSQKEAKACIDELEKAVKKPPSTIVSHVERVLDTKSRSNLESLIIHCELLDAPQNTAGEGLRASTIAELQLPAWHVSDADSIVNELDGWIEKRALQAWQESKPAWIQRDHFVSELHAIMDRRKRQIKRERSENLLPVSGEEIGEEIENPFVKQIYLVSDDQNVIRHAICEFIRCNIEKGRMAEEGNTTDDDWTAFEAALQSRWQKIQQRVLRMSNRKPEEDIGFEIFTGTTESHREKLAGIDTEQVYLTAGTYHRLANLLRLGWHPRFEELMGKSKEK